MQMLTELQPIELTDSELDHVSGGTGTAQFGLVNVNDTLNQNQILNNNLNCNDVNVGVGVGSIIVQKA